LQAVDWGPACPQPSEYTGATKGVRDVDEDCLYLNIFTPSVSIVFRSNKYMLRVNNMIKIMRLIIPGWFWTSKQIRSDVLYTWR
jgi:hypothetical protein